MLVLPFPLNCINAFLLFFLFSLITLNDAKCASCTGTPAAAIGVAARLQRHLPDIDSQASYFLHAHFAFSSELHQRLHASLLPLLPNKSQ